jgi:hypothetical protein
MISHQISWSCKASHAKKITAKAQGHKGILNNFVTWYLGGSYKKWRHFMNLENFAVNAGTLVILIFGLVEFAKQMGAQGSGLRVLSMVIGLVLAMIFKLREIYPTFVVWIDLFLFSIAGGLAACGLYGFLNERFPSR